MSRAKNTKNITLTTLIHHGKGLARKDITCCPDCQSLNLVEKLYIINPETMQIEITGGCGDCEKSFRRTVQLEYNHVGSRNRYKKGASK